MLSITVLLILIAASSVRPAIYETMDKNNDTMGNYETSEDTEENTTNYSSDVQEEAISEAAPPSDDQTIQQEFSAPPATAGFGQSSPKTFGLYLNGGHFWKPFFSKFNLQLGYYNPEYPNYYGGGYYNVKHPKLWDVPGMLASKALAKAAVLFSGGKGTGYNDFSHKYNVYHN